MCLSSFLRSRLSWAVLRTTLEPSIRKNCPGCDKNPCRHAGFASSMSNTFNKARVVPLLNQLIVESDKADKRDEAWFGMQQHVGSSLALVLTNLRLTLGGWQLLLEVINLLPTGDVHLHPDLRVLYLYHIE